jgi:hypothetical protein
MELSGQNHSPAAIVLGERAPPVQIKRGLCGRLYEQENIFPCSYRYAAISVF